CSSDLLVGQVHEPLNEGASDAGHGAADHMRIGIVFDHAHEGGSYVGQQALQRADGGSFEDVVHQVQAATRLVTQYIGQVDQTDGPATIQYGKVVNVRSEERRVGTEGTWGR